MARVSKKVVARYNEDVSWCVDCDIIQKGKDIPNKGRESSSYAWWIYQNYDNLPENIIFLQGNPFEHAKDINQETYSIKPLGDIFICDRQGNPHHPGLEIERLANLLDIEIPDKLCFVVGAQFVVHRDLILKRPKVWYKLLYLLANYFPNAPWILERLWLYMWK
jgi:hypothetical protein